MVQHASRKQIVPSFHGRAKRQRSRFVHWRQRLHGHRENFRIEVLANLNILASRQAEPNWKQLHVRSHSLRNPVDLEAPKF